MTQTALESDEDAEKIIHTVSQDRNYVLHLPTGLELSLKRGIIRK